MHHLQALPSPVVWERPPTTTPPSAPGSVSYDAGPGGSPGLTWAAATGHDSYVVSFGRNGESVPGGTVAPYHEFYSFLVDASETSFYLPAWIGESQYSLIVTACNQAGSADGTQVYGPPVPPVLDYLTDSGTLAANIGWHHVAQTGGGWNDGFEMQMSLDFGEWEHLASYPPSQDNDQVYFGTEVDSLRIRVRAYKNDPVDGSLYSEWSNVLETTISA